GAAAAREGENAQNGYVRKMSRPTHNATPLRRFILTIRGMTVGRGPSRLANWNSSSETPAGEGIGAPIRGTSIGSVSAIELKTRVSSRTEALAFPSSWCVRPTSWTLTNMSDFLALTDGGPPIGQRLKRETSSVHNRKNRRHHEHHVTHSTLSCAFASIDMNGILRHLERK